MRHMLRDQHLLLYALPVEAVDERSGETTTTFEGAVPEPFYANVQSASGQAAAAEYGMRLPYTFNLYGCTEPLEVGTGVYLDATYDENDEDEQSEPDCVVIAVKRTPRERSIVIQKRGGFGG